MDWSKRAEYVRSRHGIDPVWADEAVDDDHAVWLVPDPASRTGRSVRVIGHSIGAQDVLTVILVHADVDVTEQPAGDWWGSNAWVANAGDRRLYGKEE
ncbi:MAG: transposase [Acidimicrobiales bacterium]